MYGYTSIDLDALQRAELQDLRKILGRLTDYCDQRITLLGGIGDSALCQKRMDEIYATLPAWAQWGKQAPKFEPFTEGVRSSIVKAQDEAKQRGSSTIGTVDLLLGVLTIVQIDGIDLDRVRRDARSATVGGGDSTPDGFTPGARKVIEDCFAQARDEKVGVITTRHLLIALAQGEGRSARVMAMNGLTPQFLRGLR